MHTARHLCGYYIRNVLVCKMAPKESNNFGHKNGANTHSFHIHNTIQSAPTS